MINRKMRVAAAALLCATALACQKAGPVRPSGVDTASADAASVTDARTGVTIIAARPASPAAGAQIAWTAQPITLSVTNGVTTGSTALTYTFEVSTDAAFGSVTQSKAGIAAGAGGTTSASLDKLAGSKTYYWRVQVKTPTAAGPYSAVRSFTVGPEVQLGTPTLVSPIGGNNAFTPVQLTVKNISRTGPVGPLTYTIDLANDANFNDMVYSADTDEQGAADGQTFATAPANLVSNRTYYWRARVSDPKNGIVSAYSATGTFVAQSFNINTVKMWDSPPDFGAWPIATQITSIEFTGSAMRVDFDRREGPNRWPDQVPPGFAGPLQYTLGMCRFLEGGWHCAGVVEFWYGRDINDTAPPSRFWREWWYDAARWGPLALYPPQEGEMVGVFVGAGDLRGRTWTRATCPGICERSNIAFVPFTAGYAYYGY